MEYIIVSIWFITGFFSWLQLEKNDYRTEVTIKTYILAVLMSWAGCINLLVFLLKLLFEEDPDSIYR